MSRLALTSGSFVSYNNQNFTIKSSIDFETLLCQNIQTNEVLSIKISELNQIQNEENGQLSDIGNIEDKEWDIAKQRLDVITPLLINGRTKKDVQRVSKTSNVHMSTLYRWLKAYEYNGLLTSLLPQKRGFKTGNSRLDDDQGLLIKQVIEECYLDKQKRSVQATYVQLQRMCRNAGIKCPHVNTLRHWINALNEQNVVKQRKGHKTFKEAFHLNRGEFPGATHPLAVIQIDHTPLDIIVVDEADRMPIGRPWITLAMDVYSRMITGIYVSMDAPSAASVGLCISNSILMKNNWLTALGVENKWPVWGIPQIIHADNAKEFRGKVLQKACEQYGIDLHWRPVATPHYGGHVERVLGTFAKQLHALPGTTFSNIKQKGEYDSAKKASLTLEELEVWLVEIITGVYHQQVHNSILCSPIKKFEEGVFGNDETPGVGLPDQIIEESKLKLDFMPYVERTVQSYGISIDNIIYNHDLLRCWVNAKEPNNSKLKRKFIIRRDPRNISVVYFYDPELKEYLDIPYSNPMRPVISLWELREIRRKLVEQGISGIDESVIFKTYDKLHELVETSKKKTQKVRRQAYRKKNHPQPITQNVTSQSYIESPDAEDVSDITPFEDLDIL
jgi:putative transposase